MAPSQHCLRPAVFLSEEELTAGAAKRPDAWSLFEVEGLLEGLGPREGGILSALVPSFPGHFGSLARTAQNGTVNSLKKVKFDKKQTDPTCRTSCDAHSESDWVACARTLISSSSSLRLRGRNLLLTTHTYTHTQTHTHR